MTSPTASSLGVTVAGLPYRHQIFHLILSHAGWRYAELAEPKALEAPALTLSGKPDLKVYDRLLTGSLATAGVCG